MNKLSFVEPYRNFSLIKKPLIGRELINLGKMDVQDFNRIIEKYIEIKYSKLQM